MRTFIFLVIFLFNTLNAAENATQTATFAGGCFWCVEKEFDQLHGVISATSGYTGGTKRNPTYSEVSGGGTGHVEAVNIIYDPSEVSYEKLLDIYFHNIDPTRDDGQFCDKGSQYRPVIFYHGEKQKVLAESYRQRLINEKKMQPIRVQILPASAFYPAEEYHQNYYKKNPLRYKYYVYRCGRAKRLKELWGKASG